MNTENPPTALLPAVKFLLAHAYTRVLVQMYQDLIPTDAEWGDEFELRSNAKLSIATSSDNSGYLRLDVLVNDEMCYTCEYDAVRGNILKEWQRASVTEAKQDV
jgi:hypothetical protein